MSVQRAVAAAFLQANQVLARSFLRFPPPSPCPSISLSHSRVAASFNQHKVGTLPSECNGAMGTKECKWRWQPRLKNAQHYGTRNVTKYMEFDQGSLCQDKHFPQTSNNLLKCSKNNQRSEKTWNFVVKTELNPNPLNSIRQIAGISVTPYSSQTHSSSGIMQFYLKDYRSDERREVKNRTDRPSFAPFFIVEKVAKNACPLCRCASI